MGQRLHALAALFEAEVVTLHQDGRKNCNDRESELRCFVRLAALRFALSSLAMDWTRLACAYR